VGDRRQDRQEAGRPRHRHRHAARRVRRPDPRGGARPDHGAVVPPARRGADTSPVDATPWVPAPTGGRRPTSRTSRTGHASPRSCGR
jgi:hypothetical protein